MQGLLEQGISIDACPRANGATLLILAVDAGQPAMVQFLYEQGADTGAKDHAGQTALMHAARLGNLNILQYLLDKDIEPEEKWTGPRETAKAVKNALLTAAEYSIVHV